ncbi:hypothetical protein CDD81_6930 [Ophiocordyceps australis]|uniref:Anaphase-promoting complex subunit 4 n=1 Tax=Ophiocordyceps australis TaxID=1399860 RepID=A0A2C5Y6E8_9HYPO|nr:hypothetical protein CDD81_6930 [Ophiocordyceps australis]
MSEMRLDFKLPAGYPVACPTVDLAAVPDGDGKALLVKRPRNFDVLKGHGPFRPGQRPAEVVAVAWQTDGQQVVVGWSNGSVRLVALDNPTPSYHAELCCTPPGTVITRIGCAVKLVSARTLDLPHDHGRRQPSRLPPGWIKDKLYVDFEPILPKLSPFPASSAGPDELATLFTQRVVSDLVSSDTSSAEAQDSLNLMVVGTDDGKLQLILHHSLVIGSFDCPVQTPLATPRLLDYASNALLSTQLLLFADTAHEPDHVWMVPMDLPFLMPTDFSLSHLCHMLANLTNLFRYLKQASLHLGVEWKNATELPKRFLQSAQATLQEAKSGPQDITTALYHLALSGHAHKQLREWLVDSVGERGHKRWDKAVDTALKNMRTLVHENLLPATDRCVMVLSRLHGFSQAYADSDHLDFAPAQVCKITNIINGLVIVSHEILQDVMDQLEYFAAFSDWLYFHIDRLTSGTTEDLTDREAALNSSNVITFVQDYLTTSPLDVYFDEVTDEDAATARRECGQFPDFLDLLDSQLQKQAGGRPYLKALPNIHFVIDHATSMYSNLVDTIADGKRRSVRFGSAVRLSVGHPISNISLAMCPNFQESPVMCAALTCSHVNDKVFFFRSTIEIVSGISTSQPATACCIHVGPGQVLDAQFIDARILVLTCSDADNRTVIIPVSHDQKRLACGPYDAEKPQAMATVSLENCQAYTLPSRHNMKPVRVQAFGAAGYMPARICLLAGNGTTWKTFLLPQEYSNKQDDDGIA